MNEAMPISPQTQKPASTGLDYFRQAAEDASRQPPSTYEEKLAQSRRNREQREGMAEDEPPPFLRAMEAREIEARANPAVEANYARALLEIFDAEGAQWIEVHGLTEMCDALRAIQAPRRDCNSENRSELRKPL